MSTAQTAEKREDAAAALGAVSSAVRPAKTGVGQKVAIAGTILRLAKRYPVATIVIAGAALAFYASRRYRRATAR